MPEGPNTAIGNKALYSNTIGYSNVAIGSYSLYNNTYGSINTATGFSALKYNTTGGSNTANGASALSYNTTGSANTANGDAALCLNTTGSHNTSNGYYALFYNTTGYFNVANGSEALFSNNSGSHNVANGPRALYSNTTGNDNTANGDSALYKNNSGNYNVAAGHKAGLNNTTASYNTFLGDSAGYNITTGSQNSFLGARSYAGSSSVTNAAAIGFNASIGYSNMMMFGNAKVKDWGFGNAVPAPGYALAVGTSSNNGNGAKLTDGGVWTNASDKNLKEDFQQQDVQQILEKVNKLLITRWKYKGTENEYHIGPVAQDFYKIFNVGLDDKSISTIDPAGVALLAIQALSRENENLKSQIDDLRSMLLQLQQNINSCNPCMQHAAMSNDLSVLNNTSLQQNIPNPFNNSTTINYTLPLQYSSAKIIVVDKSGKVLKEINLADKGKGSLTLNASSLAAGAYSYSLYVNGKLVDTKQMAVSR